MFSYFSSLHTITLPFTSYLPFSSLHASLLSVHSVHSQTSVQLSSWPHLIVNSCPKPVHAPCLHMLFSMPRGITWCYTSQDRTIDQNMLRCECDYNECSLAVQSVSSQVTLLGANVNIVDLTVLHTQVYTQPWFAFVEKQFYRFSGKSWFTHRSR